MAAAAVEDPSTISDLAAQSGELYLNQGGHGGAGEVWAWNGCRRRYSRSEMVALQWAHGDEEENWDRRLEELDPILVDKSKQRMRGKGRDLCRRRYTREEMEAVGLALGEDVQQKRWSEIYGSLAPVIARVLDQIFVTTCQKRSNGKVDGSQGLKKNLDEPCFRDFADVDAATMPGN